MVSWVGSRVEAAIDRASIDPGAWQGVTDALASAIPGVRAALVGHDATAGQNLPSVQSGFAEEFVRSYAAHYGRVVPRLSAWTTLPVGRVVHAAEIVPEDELLRSEYFNDWLRPQGDLRNAAISVIQREPGRLVLFTAQVELRQAERTLPTLMRLARGLAPRLRHALEVNRMMLGLRLDAEVLRLGLEPDGAAVLLISEQGGLLHANARAEALLAEGRVLRHDMAGRLAFAEVAADARLRSALRERCAPGAVFRAAGPCGPWNVRTARMSGEIMDRLSVPLFTSATEARLLVVLRPERSDGDRARRMAERLGLTRAESEVALAIADGSTAAEVAEARRASVHTVRSQLKAILAKTGARRQSELVRIVTGVLPQV